MFIAKEVWGESLEAQEPFDVWEICEVHINDVYGPLAWALYLDASIHQSLQKNSEQYNITKGGLKTFLFQW